MRNGRILVATLVASVATLVSVAPAGADGVMVCNVKSNSPTAFVTASGGTCMPMGSNAALVAAAAHSPALDLLTDTPPNDPGTTNNGGNPGTGGGIG